MYYRVVLAHYRVLEFAKDRKDIALSKCLASLTLSMNFCRSIRTGLLREIITNEIRAKTFYEEMPIGFRVPNRNSSGYLGKWFILRD